VSSTNGDKGFDEFEKGLLDPIAFTVGQTNVLAFKCFRNTAKLQHS